MNYALATILAICAAIAAPSAAQTVPDPDCSASATQATGYTPGSETGPDGSRVAGAARGAAAGAAVGAVQNNQYATGSGALKDANREDKARTAPRPAWQWRDRGTARTAVQADAIRMRGRRAMTPAWRARVERQRMGRRATRRNRGNNATLKQGRTCGSCHVPGFVFRCLCAAERSGPRFAQNASNSVHMRVHDCGKSRCGTVVWANDKAKADSARGGTPDLVGSDPRSSAKSGPKVWERGYRARSQ